MVNIRAIANRATSGINPNVNAQIQICNGYTTGAGLRRTPTYGTAFSAIIQVQALGKRDVEHLDSLNITNAERSCYSNIQLTAVDRKTQSGGDLVTYTDPVAQTSDTWLVVAVFEGFSTAGWSRVALAKQLDGAI